MAKFNKPIEQASFQKWCEKNGISPEGQYAQDDLWPAWEARAKIGSDTLDTVAKFEQAVGDAMTLDQEIITKLDAWLHKKEVFDAVKNLPGPIAHTAGEILGLVLRRRDQSSHSNGLRRPVV